MYTENSVNPLSIIQPRREFEVFIKVTYYLKLYQLFTCKSNIFY
jgi:hypothetical protein